SGGEFTRVTQRCWVEIEKIGIERDDYGCRRNIINVLTSCGGGVNIPACHRIPLMPARVWKFLRKICQLATKRRRCDGLGENAQTRAACLLLAFQRYVQFRQEIVPRTDLSCLGDGLGAIGIVKIGDIRLRPTRRRPESGRWLRAASY